jgi:hypothetical protein
MFGAAAYAAARFLSALDTDFTSLLVFSFP